MIHYVNTLPLRSSWEDSAKKHEVRLFFNTPAQINKGMQEGKFDCALMSSTYFLYFKDTYSWQHMGYGICAKEKVLSVLLLIPKDQSLHTLSEIQSTTESCASVNMLKILCQFYWKISPTIFFNAAPPRNKAHLVIGNEALNLYSLSQEYDIIDLAEIWHAFTGLSSIFGLLAARSDIPEASMQKIVMLLENSLMQFDKNPRFTLEKAKKNLTISDALLKKYFQSIHYKLDDNDIQSIQFLNDRLNEIEPFTGFYVS